MYKRGSWEHEQHLSAGSRALPERTGMTTEDLEGLGVASKPPTRIPFYRAVVGMLCFPPDPCGLRPQAF